MEYVIRGQLGLTLSSVTQAITFYRDILEQNVSRGFEPLIGPGYDALGFVGTIFNMSADTQWAAVTGNCDPDTRCEYYEYDAPDRVPIAYPAQYPGVGHVVQCKRVGWHRGESSGCRSDYCYGRGGASRGRRQAKYCDPRSIRVFRTIGRGGLIVWLTEHESEYRRLCFSLISRGTLQCLPSKAVCLDGLHAINSMACVHFSCLIPWLCDNA